MAKTKPTALKLIRSSLCSGVIFLLLFLILIFSTFFFVKPRPASQFGTKHDSKFVGKFPFDLPAPGSQRFGESAKRLATIVRWCDLTQAWDQIRPDILALEFPMSAPHRMLIAPRRLCNPMCTPPPVTH